MKKEVPFGEYKITDEIGRGGFAIVYKATNPIGSVVALKVLDKIKAMDDKQLKRFRREAKIAKSLRHKNIVKVLDYGDEGTMPYIVMEYLEGETLDDHITARKKPLDPEE